MNPVARRASLAALAALVTLAPLSGAQTIGGQVIDRASRLPARAVDVFVLGDSGVALGRATTDAAGVFYVNLKDSARVRLEFGVGGIFAGRTDTMRLAPAGYLERSFLVDLPRVYTTMTVEKQAAAIPGTGSLRYPPAMKAAKVSGEVVAEFVVDTTGDAIMSTFHVVRATNQDFVDAVRAGLVGMRFYPALLAGRKVRQLAQMPFGFRM